ncbi:B-box zinc finger protein 20 [Apostasia shenzhenica]|uniref:B-box zinc finger protein 20 n=1 Tax=Apostasia shenzhenica TaxID=1088818 RepID=A0A2I0ALJ1_9ASPA|nr:B-box zinc finger protein 20 [Apostasia shenzhenica]
MKIQCDVCGIEPAAVLCCADEAALCARCDSDIHSANKLAGKHPRVSLLHPSPQPLPLCDNCKENRGFIFCMEDRAILCTDCDVPIHGANTQTGKHRRFLLTGIRISSTAISSPSSKAAAVEVGDGVDGFVPAGDSEHAGSSISDYLTKMLPGWRVDDFLADDDLPEPGPPPPEATGPEISCTSWEVAGHHLPICVPLFSPLMSQGEVLLPAMGSVEGSRSRRRESVSMVPEVGQIHHDHSCSKRSRSSLWF